MLLEMRNNSDNSINPEIELLKHKVEDSEKKLGIERTKMHQKEKELEHLKKKMEEDRDSLEKIAD